MQGTFFHVTILGSRAASEALSIVRPFEICIWTANGHSGLRESARCSMSSMFPFVLSTFVPITGFESCDAHSRCVIRPLIAHLRI